MPIIHFAFCRQQVTALNNFHFLGNHFQNILTALTIILGDTIKYCLQVFYYFAFHITEKKGRACNLESTPLMPFLFLYSSDSSMTVFQKCFSFCFAAEKRRKILWCVLFFFFPNESFRTVHEIGFVSALKEVFVFSLPFESSFMFILDLDIVK